MHRVEYRGLPPSEDQDSNPAVTVREATRHDMQALTRCQDIPATFYGRFRSLDYCAVATVKGRVVGYEWFCARPSCTEERYSYTVEIPEDAIYAYDAFILPGYRRAGIWSKLQTNYLRNLMLLLDKQRIVAMIDHGNNASMAAHMRFGYRRFVDVFVFKCFSKSLCVARAVNVASYGTGSIADDAVPNSDRRLYRRHTNPRVPSQLS